MVMLGWGGGGTMDKVSEVSMSFTTAVAMALLQGLTLQGWPHNKDSRIREMHVRRRARQTHGDQLTSTAPYWPI